MSKSKKPQPQSPTTISETLRTLIAADGRTVYAIAKEAGVSAGMVHRFINRERTLHLDTIDKLASVLGLQLVRRDGEL